MERYGFNRKNGMFTMMVFDRMQEEQRQFLSYTNEELDRKTTMKNEGIGLLIFGITLVILGVVHQILPFELFFDTDSEVVKIVISVIMGILGIVCCVFGIRCFGKMGISIAEGVCDANHNFYTKEDIHDYYREVREGKNVLIFLSGKMKIKSEDEANVGLFTDNWMKIPRQGSSIARLTDIVAAWHDKDGSKDGFVGLYILRSDGELYAMDSHPEFSEKVMQAIRERNPMTILARHFTYEGRTYDACVNTAQVIELYRQNMERQLNAGMKGI